ncbi:hypothetical protein BW723_01775 [Polaribacter reichenbachii]|uniref:Uncharacterized protein n=1 Tax=Polaribacter reichenbachii TaxID=996801 RepID=A0A1B8TWB3_9FLAO|nr:DUF4173 domain-containing protein [Polaribacter reichenbachii]APZ45101.1 hypothetical protein BW723_01775 [Polaribacter reichenbachii]AUC18963.1 hypothetical protein BTO17_09775 [Polaribacter reichenbachii]OBY63880.1 hypothetical protein LPB301_13925 [Polaribacter reichenbachii]
MEIDIQKQETSKKWMKLVILLGAIFFSLLFYQQNFGLNLFLFTVLSIAVLVINNPKSFHKNTIRLNAIGYYITGITIFLYNSNLTIIANIIAFFTLIGSISEHKSSVYINWINGIYTATVAVFTLHFEKINNEKKPVKRKKTDYAYWFKIVGIPLIIAIIFISLYRNGNPKFDELIRKIDFSFINFQWLVLTGLGYYLFYNITNPIQIEPVTSTDLKTGNNLLKEKLKYTSPKKLKGEKQMGIILLSTLNLLIVLFLITDALYLFEIHKMSAPELSEQVHTGVNALIISNLLAIIVILYFFRGNLNFIKDNKNLKVLTFIWISLNLIMILITAIKNIEYIFSFGLTYKRIGVLFFLLLTAIGLITTYFKVTNIKNLWYLVRKNIQIAFMIFIISSTVNWDKIITYYNINNAEVIDLKYLINLSNNNAFLLKDYIEKNKIKNYKINEKHRNYVSELENNSWQEMVFDNLKIK